MHVFHTPPTKNSVSESVTKTTSIGDTSNPNVEPSIAATASSGTVKGPQTPGFTQFKDKNTALIRFTPSWGMAVVQLTGGGGSIAPNLDMTTKEFTNTQAFGRSIGDQGDGEEELSPRIERTKFKLDHLPRWSINHKPTIIVERFKGKNEACPFIFRDLILGAMHFAAAPVPGKRSSSTRYLFAALLLDIF